MFGGLGSLSYLSEPSKLQWRVSPVSPMAMAECSRARHQARIFKISWVHGDLIVVIGHLSKVLLMSNQAWQRCMLLLLT